MSNTLNNIMLENYNNTLRRIEETANSIYFYKQTIINLESQNLADVANLEALKVALEAAGVEIPSQEDATSEPDQLIEE